MNVADSLRTMPNPLRASVAIGALHAAGFLYIGISWWIDSMSEPKFVELLRIMATAALVMGLCLAAATYGIVRKKKFARAPLLVLFLVEAFSFLFTIGNMSWWLSALGLLSVVGIWGLLPASTRAFLGVEDRPTKFD